MRLHGRRKGREEGRGREKFRGGFAIKQRRVGKNIEARLREWWFYPEVMFMFGSLTKK